MGTQRLLAGGLLLAGHDRSDGGLLVTVLEMAFAGRIGCSLNLETPCGGKYGLFAALFSEAPGLVYEVRRHDLGAVWRLLEAEGVTAVEIGSTRSDMKIVLR